MSAPPSAAALRAALEAAGEAALAFFGRASVTRKADGSPLTQADLAAQESLRRSLNALLPEAGWLSEETPDDAVRLEREWVWVVDPLDGTKEFAAGVPQFALSVGLARAGVAVAGGVYNPATREGGVASGGAAVFWGLPPALPPAPSLSAARASVSRTELEDGSARPFLGAARCEPVGGCAYKLLRAAAGVEHLTFSVQPKSEWDVCGGVALLEAAGKAYRRLDGAPNRFNRPDTRIRCGAAGGDPALVARMIEVLDSRPTCS
jgi:myo-inositol-1(or 4)-monophosphatase